MNMICANMHCQQAPLFQAAMSNDRISNDLPLLFVKNNTGMLLQVLFIMI